MVLKNQLPVLLKRARASDAYGKMEAMLNGILSNANEDGGGNFKSSIASQRHRSRPDQRFSHIIVSDHFKALRL